MTAAYLKRALPSLESVTVLESASIKTIGVGEATFSTLKLFFDFLGLHEKDWMPPCNATYKLAIKFVNWTASKGHFYHPFQRLDVVDGLNAAEWWLKLRRDQPFDRVCFTIPAMCQAHRSPSFLDGTVFDDRVRDYFTPDTGVPNKLIAHHVVQYPYGYHFDASLVARYLQDYAMRHGVHHLVDDLTAAEKTESGDISHLLTKQHGRLDGDLFIDCTGFKSMLIGESLNEPFISFNDSLPNDRAVAIQVPWDAETHGIRPYTTATALNAGWAWTIPLFHRNGCGYVYCSNYASPDEAEEELRSFLGPASTRCSANHIKMRIGRHRNSWVKNCGAIGLFSGFVEPLESTGIFFIQHGIEELVNHFPIGHSVSEEQRMSYNRVIGECIDGVREFLTIHYCATDRADTPYWRDMKTLRLPPSLAERMSMYFSRLPGKRNIYQPFHGFEAYSWSVVLLGMNCVPKTYPPALDHIDTRQAEAMFQDIQIRSKLLTEKLPSHYDYLKLLRSEEGLADSRDCYPQVA